MAALIKPRIVRGCLYFQIGPVFFISFRAAASAWSAAEADRLDIVGGAQ